MWKVGVKIPLYFEVKSILVLSTSPRRPKRARVSLSLAHKSFYQTYTNLFSKFTQIFSSNPNKSFSQTETKRCQTHTNLFIKLKHFFSSNSNKSFYQTHTNLFIKLTQILLSNSHTFSIHKKMCSHIMCLTKLQLHSIRHLPFYHDHTNIFFIFNPFSSYSHRYLLSN